jgi:serine/threonine protein kinase
VKILRKKVLDVSSKNLLEREIAVMSKLHHPNIVQMIEAFDTPKKTYLILELYGAALLIRRVVFVSLFLCLFGGLFFFLFV